MIGDKITVTVLDIERGKVRLGIDAPRSVPICRQEIVIEHPKLLEVGGEAGAA